MDYALTPDGEIDWDRPVRVTCLCCHASLTISAGEVLQAARRRPATAAARLPPYPARAARAPCTGCGLFLPGPALDARQREEPAVTEGLTGLALRETYLAAKARPHFHAQ